MEGPKKLDQKKKTRATKKAQSKNKPLKVVYISNPVKFKTSASEFRALVQELTGQDAEWHEPNKLSLLGDSQTVPNADGHGDDYRRQHNHMVEAPWSVEYSDLEDHIMPSWSDLHFKPFDRDHDQLTFAEHDHQVLEDFYSSDHGNANSVSQ